MEGFGCDPKHCEQCNPGWREAKAAKRAVEDAITYSMCNLKLEKLLAANDLFDVKGRRFILRQYISQGYQVSDNTVTVTFVRDTFCGVLSDGVGNKKIYHTGTLARDDCFPRYCEHIFLNKNKNGEKGPDVDAIKHVKILFHDSVFEDFVHSGDGVIIDESELDALLIETEQPQL